MLFVGNDWAEDHHDVEIVDEQGRRLARRRFPEGLEGVTGLHALIAQFVPDEWVALEPADAASRVKVGTAAGLSIMGAAWGSLSGREFCMSETRHSSE